jgi:hypothetical protein
MMNKAIQNFVDESLIEVMIVQMPLIQFVSILNVTTLEDDFESLPDFSQPFEPISIAVHFAPTR